MELEEVKELPKRKTFGRREMSPATRQIVRSLLMLRQGGILKISEPGADKARRKSLYGFARTAVNHVGKEKFKVYMRGDFIYVIRV